MAYSNWGAFVYKDKVRRNDKEDVGVFDTDESNLPPGSRIFANILKSRETNTENDWSRHSHHAVLGDGDVRLCGYKSNPELWAVKDGVPTQIELPKPDESSDEWELKNQSGEIKLGERKWSWEFNQFGGNMIDLKLTEPDGSVWMSRCGFEYGAGWTNE